MGVWSNVSVFDRNEFQTPLDVHSAFEDFLCAAKGSLTASQIAKIRDHVGVIGMAGTWVHFLFPFEPDECLGKDLLYYQTYKHDMIWYDMELQL